MALYGQAAAAGPSHHFGVALTELLLGPGHPALPRVLVYMCESVLLACARLPAERIHALVTEPPADDDVRAVRDQYDRGVWFDCRSPAVVFQLLRQFFRELPSPLLPSSMYPEALSIVTDHVRRSLGDLRRGRTYEALLTVQVRAGGGGPPPCAAPA
jgi:hypothetical protein